LSPLIYRAEEQLTGAFIVRAQHEDGCQHVLASLVTKPGLLVPGPILWVVSATISAHPLRRREIDPEGWS
jgi:hypothetical protein